MAIMRMNYSTLLNLEVLASVSRVIPDMAGSTHHPLARALRIAHRETFQAVEEKKSVWRS